MPLAADGRMATSKAVLEYAQSRRFARFAGGLTGARRLDSGGEPPLSFTKTFRRFFCGFIK
jgi:hypothetical protein